MKCKKCGCDLEINDKFCYNCGEAVENNIEQTEIKEPIFPDAKEVPLPGTNSVNEVSDKTSTFIEATKSEAVVETPSQAIQQKPLETEKNKKSNPIVLVIIIVLAIVAAVLLFLLLYGTEGLKMAGKTTTTTTTSTTTKTTTKALLANEHVIDSIKITVPSDWVYFDNASDFGTIVSQTVGLQINISPMNSVNFENSKNDQTIIDNSLTEKGIQIIGKNTIYYEEKEYLYYEVVNNNTNQIFLFTSMNNGNTIRFEIATPNADYNVAMPFINPIANSAEIYN